MGLLKGLMVLWYYMKPVTFYEAMLRTYGTTVPHEIYCYYKAMVRTYGTMVLHKVYCYYKAMLRTYGTMVLHEVYCYYKAMVRIMVLWYYMKSTATIRLC